jgi:hypothetical protein
VQLTPSPRGAAVASFGSISCAQAAACMAVGDFAGLGNELLAESWNGTHCSVVTTPQA